MNGVLIDSNVLLDLFTDDPRWAESSESAILQASTENTLFINSIIYSEISIGFLQIELLEESLKEMDIRVLEVPREALFLAGKVYLRYKSNQGTKKSTLPDFFIGSHALVSKFRLLTRDTRRYQTYFPTVDLVSPK